MKVIGGDEWGGLLSPHSPGVEARVCEAEPLPVEEVEELMQAREARRETARKTIEDGMPEDWAPAESLRIEWIKAQRVDPALSHFFAQGKAKRPDDWPELCA